MSPVKPSEKEEEYFLRKEAEKLKAHAEKVRKEMEEAERARLKELHWMRCPKCGTRMTGKGRPCTARDLLQLLGG